MNIENLFISNTEGYKIYSDLINEVLKTSSGLPENVFNNEYKNFLFEEFDWAMTEEFSEKLKWLAIETNEPYIIVAVLEPNPSEYYFEEFGYYNWIKIPTHIFNSVYLEVLEHSPESSLADSILYNSQKVVWTVPSAKWVIFGDRDYGTCIWGCKQEYQNEGCQILKNWKPVEDALESWIKLCFRNQNVPKEFRHQMISSYKK